MLHHHHTTPQNPARVVLLGGSGFIGQEISKQLEEQNIPTLLVSSRDVDLTHPSAVEKLEGLLKETDAVVFLSALTPDKGKGIDTFEKNINMAMHLAKALEKKPIGHLVYFSSDAIYKMEEAVVTETTPPEPQDLYGLMHFTREKMMQMAFKDTAVIRPTLVYGLADTHNSYGPNRFRRMAEEKKEITLFGGGEETRDHIFVADLADIIVQVLRHKSVGQLNAVTGKSISYVDLAHKVSSLYGADKVKVTLTERKNPITHRHFDNTNLFKAFPKFQFTDLDDGLKKVHNETEHKVKS